MATDSACALAPAWLVIFGLWALHIQAEGAARKDWAAQARLEEAKARKEMADAS